MIVQLMNSQLERIYRRNRSWPNLMQSQHLPGETEEDHYYPQSGQPVSGPRSGFDYASKSNRVQTRGLPYCDQTRHIS
jgi:hypothetical protein